MRGFRNRKVLCRGLSLVELLLSTAVLALVAAAAVTLSSASLEAHRLSQAGSRLQLDGQLIMDRVTDAIRRATFVSVPNSGSLTRDELVVSGFTNDDGDFYFGDPLFPRIDEDTGDDMNADGKNGVIGFDDDGDGPVDEGPGSDHNDDEDDDEDEDPFNGVDDDKDGNVDEDLGQDGNLDGEPGLAGVDDDGDGEVDEGDHNDDDEDGLKNEDPLNERLYLISEDGSFCEVDPPSQTFTVLSTAASSFSVSLITPNLFLVKLTLADSDGESVSFSQYAYARNTYQECGRRVR